MKMRCDLPDFKRCCLCVPLRHGILIFGYLNLLFSIFNLGVVILVESDLTAIFVFRGVSLLTHVWFPCLIFILEVVFNVVLLIGAHRKDLRILRAYYYYGITTTLAAFLAFIVARHFNEWQNWYPSSFEIYIAFSGIALQCYLLMLIRSELIKPRYQEGQLRYVNHMAEVVVDTAPSGDGGNPL